MMMKFKAKCVFYYVLFYFPVEVREICLCLHLLINPITVYQPHLFSNIDTTIRASCFQLSSFTVSAYFIYSIRVIVHWIFVVVLHISVLLYSVYYLFCSTHKSRSVVS
jgi:hypothetical protein